MKQGETDEAQRPAGKAMSHDEVSWWREQKRQFSIAQGNASTGPLYEAGDAICRALESCREERERLRGRVEALCSEWESGPASSEDEAHGVMMCVRELRAALDGERER